MSASESVRGAANLHQSIEQLIAETVRQSQTTHESEQQKLKDALKAALADIDSARQTMNRAAETLRAAIGEEPQVEATPTVVDVVPDEVKKPEAVESIPSTTEAGPTPTPTNDRGPHELDVIAHNANIATATGLQSWLRERDEVANAQIREFVNGELRLHLNMETGMDADAFGAWLEEHGGTIVTTTDKVFEVRFKEAS